MVFIPVLSTNIKRLAKKKKPDTDSLKKIIVDAILDKKGKEVVSLDLRKINDSASDYFIISHGDSNTQVKAIYDSVMEAAKLKGFLPYHTEGMRNSEWIIIDFVDVVVHIFHRDKREFYALEELWSDAKTTKYQETATKSRLK